LAHPVYLKNVITGSNTSLSAKPCFENADRQTTDGNYCVYRRQTTRRDDSGPWGWKKAPEIRRHRRLSVCLSITACRCGGWVYDDSYTSFMTVMLRSMYTGGLEGYFSAVFNAVCPTYGITDWLFIHNCKPIKRFIDTQQPKPAVFY